MPVWLEWGLSQAPIQNIVGVFLQFVQANYGRILAGQKQASHSFRRVAFIRFPAPTKTWGGWIQEEMPRTPTGIEIRFPGATGKVYDEGSKV